MALEGGPLVVYLLMRAPLVVGPTTDEYLECFTSLALAKDFLFSVKPMIERERYEWRVSPVDAQRWRLLDLMTLEPSSYVIVAKRLIHG